MLQDSSRPQQEVVRYRAGASGQVLFARLAWPGYTASVDGRTVDVTAGPAGLAVADVPAGEHVLTLTYEPPGVRTGVQVALLAGVLALAQAGVWHWQRRRARTRSVHR